MGVRPILNLPHRTPDAASPPNTNIGLDLTEPAKHSSPQLFQPKSKDVRPLHRHLLSSRHLRLPTSEGAEMQWLLGVLRSEIQRRVSHRGQQFASGRPRIQGHVLPAIDCPGTASSGCPVPECGNLQQQRRNLCVPQVLHYRWPNRAKVQEKLEELSAGRQHLFARKRQRGRDSETHQRRQSRHQGPRRCICCLGSQRPRFQPCGHTSLARSS